MVVLGRYTEQIREIKRETAGRAIVLDRVGDSESIFSVTDMFMESGGTMTTEAALSRLSTISYEGIPNADEKYSVRKGLVRRYTYPLKIPGAARRAPSATR